jgi:hypothetical protein
MFTYFADDTIHILKYDLASDRLSVLGAPAGAGLVDASILMAMQDRSLGYANLYYKSTLRWWSRQQMMGSPWSHRSKELSSRSHTQQATSTHGICGRERYRFRDHDHWVYHGRRWHIPD